MTQYDEQRPAASGVILDADRGTLPFQLIHGESLVAVAAWAAGEAGIELVDATVPLEVVAERDEPLVLHDPLCPMTPPDFLAACVERCLETDAVVVGCRPVTDTVKEVADGDLGATLDRDELLAVCSPVVLPAEVLADLLAHGGLPTTDLAELVPVLRERYPLQTLDAPPAARRVGGPEDVAVLEALTAPERSPGAQPPS